MRVGLASDYFMYAFKQHYPQLEVVGQNIDVVKYLDLVIFPGGADISTALYGEAPRDAFMFNLERDRIEKAVFNECIELGTKMLGVCRGHQLLNVLSGGRLIQNLKPGHPGEHELLWMKDHPISHIYPESVNSMHHQGYTMDEIANNMVALAVEPRTAVVEVARSVDNTILTVQFHPEFMSHSVSEPFFTYVNEWVKEVK